jgi:hypothetical protein
MIVKTKKYKLPTGTYIKLALKNVLLEQWWVILIALTIASGAFFVFSWWWIIGAVLGYGLYVLFWLIQFAGVTQLEQSKILFEKLSYEINSQQILIKVNPRQGMPIKWENVRKALIGKDYFLLIITKAQLIYLPFRIFNTEHERKFIETILKRKGYVKEKSAV